VLVAALGGTAPVPIRPFRRRRERSVLAFSSERSPSRRNEQSLLSCGTAGTGTDDPDRHAPATTRWRIGRHARSIVWVRSGPTDTSTIGAPA
jgi:hypothetical protein